MNMLARGARFLARTHDRFASSEVVYRRGASSQTLRATIGKTDFEVDQGDGMFTRFSSRDYLVTVEQFTINDVPTLPAPGDQIVEYDAGEDGSGVVYEVMAPQGKPVWSWADDYRNRYRIHTKYVGPLITGN